MKLIATLMKQRRHEVVVTFGMHLGGFSPQGRVVARG